MKFKPVSLNDWQEVFTILTTAVAFLAEQGINQWQNNYPNQATVFQDIQKQVSYQLVDENKILAVAVLNTEAEANYRKIESGTWQNNGKYATIHRFAVNQAYQGRGIGKSMFQALIQQAQQLGFNDLRVDTHPDNLVMQQLILKNGFTYRGIVYMSDNSQRLAYQRLL
ncbi:MAG: GNAT family N-acetyltransferase [Streptococcaceae bacterium]|jgi:RimJ/RimL family protein N-acetyltransferase|nr:GNAT family N-acetyltransferase [Streptococcaceae bacterium]